MDIFDEVKLLVHESYNAGEIDTYERDSLIEYIIEKKTREEYRRRAFIKKYNFKPDKPGSGKGTIEVDGKKIKVDIDKGDTRIDSDGDIVSRSTSAEIHPKDPTLVIGKEFYKVKGSKERDAIVQHEVGHMKFHGTNPDSEVLSKDMMSKKVVTDVLQNTIDQNLRAFGYTPGTKDFLNMRDAAMSVAYDRYIKKYEEALPDTPSNRAKLREIALSVLKKYAKGDHSNTTEFEADRYAANKTSASDIRKGVRRIYKSLRSDYKKLNKKGKLPSSGLKEFNKTAQEDMLSRSKALKDKDMQDKFKKIYESLQDKAIMAYESHANKAITDDELNILIDNITEKYNDAYDDLECFIRYIV